jgi:hypothetical protein
LKNNDVSLRAKRSNLLKDCRVAALLAMTLIFFIQNLPLAMASKKDGAGIHGVFVGMPESDFLKIYPRNNLRDLRHDGTNDWLTYNKPPDDPFHEVVTFYFQNEKLVSWKMNDRPEVIKEYLGEFCFYQDPSLIYQAIRDVFVEDAVQRFS